MSAAQPIAAALPNESVKTADLSQVGPLIVEDLSCVRGGRRVFAGARFEVRPGVAAILRGPNGSGKSTLLRVLAGLLPAERGDARLGAVSLASDRDGFQERLAYAGHLDAVKTAFTVRENLAFWARFYALPGAAPDGDADVDAALTRFELDHIADAPAGYCSAGQKRRLGLARLAVIARPVWLLDEPTVSLDARSVSTFAALVEAHVTAGGVVIAATHVDLGLSSAQSLDMSAFAPGLAATNDAAADPFLDARIR